MLKHVVKHCKLSYGDASDEVCRALFRPYAFLECGQASDPLVGQAAAATLERSRGSRRAPHVLLDLMLQLLPRHAFPGPKPRV